MAETGFSDKFESSVVAVKDIFLGFLLTTFHVLTLRRRLGGEDLGSRFVAPNAYLLIAAVLTGIASSYLSGLRQWRFDSAALEQLSQLTAASFLGYSLPLFIIAIVTGWITASLRFLPPALRRSVADNNYYFIGFFGLGALFLSALAALVLSYTQLPRGVILWAAYVGGALYCLWLFLALSISALRIVARDTDGRVGPGTVISLGAVSMLVVGLSLASYLYPIPLTGKVEAGMLEARPLGDSLAVTYLLTNASGNDIVVDVGGRHAFTIGDREGSRFEATFADSCCDTEQASEFVLIKDGGSKVLTSYTCTSGMATHFRKFVRGADTWYSPRPNVDFRVELAIAERGVPVSTRAISIR